MVFSWLEKILTGMESRYNVESHARCIKKVHLVKKATTCRLIIQNTLDKKLVGGILIIDNQSLSPVVTSK